MEFGGEDTSDATRPWRPVGSHADMSAPGHAARVAAANAASSAMRAVRSDPTLLAKATPPSANVSPPLRASPPGKLLRPSRSRLRVVEPAPTLPPLPESNPVLRGSKVENPSAGTSHVHGSPSPRRSRAGGGDLKS